MPSAPECNLTAAALCCALVLLSAQEAFSLPAPFFGIDSLFNPSALANGSAALGALAASHAGHSLGALQQLAEFAQLAQNLSASFFQG